MILILKAACIGAYVLALASLVGLLPPGWLNQVQTLAAALLVIHALELVFMWKHVRLYRGALAVSVLLTLLFGVLHWKKLADRRTDA